MAAEKYDTIVVGGGIAGLTSATYLAREGKKVLLIEKNKECGGLVNSFSRDGFRFEAGVRALIDGGIIFPMLKDLGIDLEVVGSPVSVGIGNDIIDIENIDSLNDYRSHLIRNYPDSKQEINEVIKLIRKVMRRMDVLYGIENPFFKDMIHDRPYLFKQLLPWLPKFLFTIGKINRMNMPVEDYLRERISDRSLLDIISQHFFKNTPTFFALSYFSLYLDYFYPKGGVGKLAEAVEKKYLEFGGELRMETTVDQVNAHEQVLVDLDGISYRYEHLIWAADLKTFYKITDIEGVSKKIEKKFRNTKKSLQDKRGGDSVFTLYLQVDEPIESFKSIANGHFFYTPSKQGLGETHWKDLDSILERWKDLDKSQILAWLDKFISLNTFEISIPALKDADMAPKGKTGLIVSVLAEYDLFNKLQESGWYEEFVTEMEDRMIKELTDSVYPMLRDKVIGRFSFTPLSYKNRVGSSEGAITGWSFQESVPSISKIQIADRSILTPIPSIFQAGQWTYSPAGVPMSILTGKLAADRVLKA